MNTLVVFLFYFIFILPNKIRFWYPSKKHGKYTLYKWFAWYPVHYNGKWVFLKYTKRLLMKDHKFSTYYWIYYDY